ncbi:MAG: HIT family protein [Telluria sp.]|nr:HIT family protein [Telluria sp.]
MSCELCEAASAPIYGDDKLRVVLVDDAAYPGFCRVIWNRHVKEVSDLAPEDRLLLNDAVWRVELALREVMAPAKVNLASLGNMTQHIHWHMIPRFTDDAHFPNPIWAGAVRTTEAQVLAERRALLPALRAAIARRMSER